MVSAWPAVFSNAAWACCQRRWYHDKRAVASDLLVDSVHDFHRRRRCGRFLKQHSVHVSLRTQRGRLHIDLTSSCRGRSSFGRFPPPGGGRFTSHLALCIRLVGEPLCDQRLRLRLRVAKLLCQRLHRVLPELWRRCRRRRPADSSFLIQNPRC